MTVIFKRKSDLKLYNGEFHDVVRVFHDTNTDVLTIVDEREVRHFDLTTIEWFEIRE